MAATIERRLPKPYLGPLLPRLPLSLPPHPLNPLAPLPLRRPYSLMTFPVTVSNFSYTFAAVAGTVVLSGMGWWVKARFWFSSAAKEGSRAAHRIPGSPKHQDSFGSSVYGNGNGSGNGVSRPATTAKAATNSPSPGPETPRFLGGTRTPPSPHLHLQAHQPQPQFHHSMSTEAPHYPGGIQRDRQSSFTRHSGTMNTTHTHSKQPSFNNSSSEQEDNDNDIEHAVQSTTATFPSVSSSDNPSTTSSSSSSSHVNIPNLPTTTQHPPRSPNPLRNHPRRPSHNSTNPDPETSRRRKHGQDD